MADLLLERLSRGLFNFLRPEPEAIRRAVPDLGAVLPRPQRIFLEDEMATPLVGFPLLRTAAYADLIASLERYLELEEEAQCAYLTRVAFDSNAYRQGWLACKQRFAHVIENTTVASHGQNYPAVLWLDMSLVLARWLKEVPKRVLRRDLSLGREHGDAIKYRVLFKVLERMVNLTYDIVQRLAVEDEKGEEDLFPPLLDRMRDNVLIFTEDHVSPDLSELSSYFRGYLQTDGRQFRQRLAATEAWYRATAGHDPLLAAALPKLLGIEIPEGSPRAALAQAGFARFLANHAGYDAGRLLNPQDVELWEGLLAKLKEFEVFHALRRMAVPLETEGEDLVSRDRSANTTWVGGPPVLRVSDTTRPYDFMAPLVVDPLVHRFGLVYDISDFSATLMLLGRSEAAALDRAFRFMVLFQRRINKLAASRRLTLEKYLGDGAFFSGRRAHSMLLVAVNLQRIYRQAVADGFPFDRGLRVALNFGHYRMLPLAEESGAGAARYEFFGHGLVELSRLATGKATRDLEDVKMHMITQGYPEGTVNKFFAPLLRRSAELVDREEERRSFYAYINANHVLINEGIVATEDFVARLGTFGAMQLATEGRRRYIVLGLESEGAAALRVGVRKLGAGRFKGLGKLPVFEIVDIDSLEKVRIQDVPSQPLMSALQRLFASDLSHHRPQSAAPKSG